MRLRSLLIFLFIHLINAEILDVSVISNQPVPKVIEAVTKETKLWSNDNRFVSVEIDEVICDGSNSELKCQTIKDETILVTVNDRTLPNRVAEVEVQGKSAISLEKELKSLFIQFSTLTFSSRAADVNQESNWWTPLFPSLLNLYKESQITSKQQLEMFLEHDLHSYLYVIYYRQDADFSNFDAVLHAARAFTKINAEFVLIDCATEGLCEHDTLPQIQAFYDVSPYMRYKNAYVTEKIVNWAQTLNAPVLSHLTEDIVPMYRSGVVPGVDGIQDTVTMLFIPSKKPLIYKNYKKFAKDNHGKYHLTVMVNKKVEQWAHQPAFITMKPKEAVQKAFVMYEDITWDRMEHFLKTGIQPSIHPLDSAQNTLEVISQPMPLVIFFDQNKQKNLTEFKTLAAEHSVRSELTLFSVIDGHDLFANYFHAQLNLSDSYPRYILLNAEKKCLKSKLISSENQAEIKHWIETSLKDETCEQELNLNMEELESIAEWEKRFMARKDYTEILRENKIEHEEL